MKALLAAILLTIFFNCAPAMAATNLTVMQVKQMMDSDPNVVVINLMPKIVHENSHIAGAINIPMNVLKVELPKKVSDKSTKLVFHCMGKK